MPTGLQRYYGKGHLHFLTFSCHLRLPLLKSKQAMALFVSELARVRTQYHFRLVGYVLMPNHVHLLMSEPSKGSVSTALQMLKQRVARGMKRGGKLPSPGGADEPRSFWQPRFYDFNVYSRGKVIEKLHYMHANPVKNGLVKHPSDWAWSSWSFYYGEGRGLVPIDHWEKPQDSEKTEEKTHPKRVQS